MINLEYSISDYNPFKILPSNVSIIIVSLLMMVLVVIYYIKLKNNKPSVTPKGYVLCVQLYIKFIENLILQSFGKKSEKISIFFSFLFIYIFLLNTISLFGFASPTSSLTVTFSLALIIFIGIIAIGFKYQRASYLKKFFFSLKILKNKQLSIFINPAKIISEITPLLSLSLRLWGNMLASFILVTVMLFYIDMFEQNHIIQYIINLFCFPITVIFKTFFDLILGFIQSFVFIILSINYWSFAKNSQ